MDVGAITSLGLSAASIAAGFMVGRRGIAAETVTMLQAQVEAHERDKVIRDRNIVLLEGRIEVLESLVTQRASVEEVRVIVERIADRVGA